MGKVSGLIQVLTENEMELLHESAIRVLEEIGMRVQNPEALGVLRDAGCNVNSERETVKFPRDVVENSIAEMRKDFIPLTRTPQNSGGLRFEKPVPMRYTAMYFTTMPPRIRSNFDVNTGGFTLFVHDLNGMRRPAQLQDVRDSVRLADALENINLVGLPCVANDVPPSLRPVVMAAELVKLTRKIGGVEAWSVKDVEYLSLIAEVVAGGNDALLKQPVLVGYGEVRSPLIIDNNMAAVFMESLKRGFPQSLDTMPAGGTTAPATSAGTLTLGLAETLGGLTLAYAVRKDAIVSIDICPTLTDMRNLIYPYSGADRIPLVTAAMQMLTQYYGRPGGCHGGKTDACVPGVQAGVEKALSVMFPILAGATGIGTLGHVENAVAFSFEQLVIDNEIVGYIRRMLEGFEVNEDSIAFDVIKEVGIGGNYLAHPHTAATYRREFWLPDLMERMPWAAWTAQGVKGLEDKARARAQEILSRPSPEPLTTEQIKEIDEIVKVARRDPWYTAQ